MFRIGLGVGRPLPSFGAFDSDAQAFLSAAGITDATQQTAINTLVVDLKADGIWSKMKAIYPFVGGTASTHKYNLKDPRDLDAAFRLVFNGGWTHSSTGATPNGTNGYADTKLSPSGNLTSNNNHLSFYSRTQNTSVSGMNMGTRLDGFNEMWMSLYYASVTSKLYNNGAYPANTAISTSTNTLGLQIGSQTSITSRKLYFNGTLLNTNTTSYSATNPNNNIYIAAYNQGSATQFTPHQCAFASIGDGLTDTEASNFYTAVQAFQTSLSRQV